MARRVCSPRIRAEREAAAVRPQARAAAVCLASTSQSLRVARDPRPRARTPTAASARRRARVDRLRGTMAEPQGSAVRLRVDRRRAAGLRAVRRTEHRVRTEPRAPASARAAEEGAADADIRARATTADVGGTVPRPGAQAAAAGRASTRPRARAATVRPGLYGSSAFDISFFYSTVPPIGGRSHV